MTMCYSRVVSLVVAMSFLAACAPAMRPAMQDALKPLSRKLPPCAIDAEASELNLQVQRGAFLGFFEVDPASPRTVETLRKDIADGLATACRLDDEPKPARFRIRGTSEGSNMNLPAMVITGMNLIWFLFWLPTGGGDSEVVVDYDYDGKVYTAKAKGSVTTGLLYNSATTEAAFVDAVGTAMADIAKQMGVSP